MVTNLLGVFERLVQRGYVVETKNVPLTCLDFQWHAHLMIVDPERQFRAEEIRYVQKLVFFKQVNLILFVEWFDLLLFKMMSPQPGLIPNNLLSINRMLKVFGIRVAYDSLGGSFQFLNRTIQYQSGTSVSEFPANNYLFFADLKREVDIIHNYKSLFAASASRYAVLGLFENFGVSRTVGKVALFGDSSCLETHEYNCLPVLDAMLDFLEGAERPWLEGHRLSKNYIHGQKASIEEEEFFEGFFASDTRPLPDCKNYFTDDFDLEGLALPEDPVGTSSTPMALKDVRKLVVVFLGCVLLFLSTLYLCKRTNERGRIRNEVNEVRIPKHSVIYI